MRIFALMLLAQSAFAGGAGWVSSGGELFRDAKNPWFVKSVTQVNYCVQVDSKTISASPALVKQIITRALSYWQKEFSKAVPMGQKGYFTIATQTFEEIDCSLGVADLTFKVGYGALETEELEYLKDPRKYIGVTVRKHYDEETLRGSGFIYISSDLGPQAYYNTNGVLLEQAWKQEQLLYYAVLHELGHVFGLPHTGSGLMSEVFLDQILTKAIYQVFVNSPVEPFFFPDNRLEWCMLQGSDKAWFGASMDYECVAVEATPSSIEIPVFGRKVGTQKWDRLGAIQSIQPDLLDIRNRPAVYLQLSPRQRVFAEDEDAAFRPFMIGANFVDFGANAVYAADSDHVRKSTYLRVTSSSFQVLAQQSGKLRLVFNYNSLIGTKLLIIP